MRVSTPEATAVDLVRFSKASGQMDNVASVIAELSPKLNSSKLLDAVEREAIRSGFAKVDEQYGIVVYRNREL